MGSFGNEYTANLQVLLPLAVAIAIILPVFGAWFNRLMDKLRGKEEHTSLYVAIGFLANVVAGALISWKAALLFLVLFSLDGVFMIVGEYKRTEKKPKAIPAPRLARKRMPYAANGLIDDIRMAAKEIHKLLGEWIKSHEPGTLLKIQRELTTVLLKLEELKNIQG